MKLNALKQLTCDLIEDARAEILAECTDPGKHDRLSVASYYLWESRECVEGAWDMVLSGDTVLNSRPK